MRGAASSARWRGHLQRLLPARAALAPVKHHKALPYAEVPAFMAALRQQAGTAARCLELTILAAARTGEAMGRAGRRSTSRPSSGGSRPGHEGGREHVVPLSRPALAILAALPRSGEHLFEGARSGRPISDMAMVMLLRGMGEGTITVHRFRSSFRDWACEQAAPTMWSGWRWRTGSGTSGGCYRRGELMAKRQRLMRDWARYPLGDHPGLRLQQTGPPPWVDALLGVDAVCVPRSQAGRPNSILSM